VNPARDPLGGPRGFIVAIGGAVDTARGAAILRRFVSLCGGSDGSIAIVPTASLLADTGAHYEAVFRALGVGEARTVPFASRHDGECVDLLDALAQATGIFLTGGEQLRLTTTLGGTSAARLLRHLNAEGVPVAGTSAGASYLSEHMIAAGRGGGTPRVGSVSLAPGLGLTNRVVIDQHFRQRDRLGRLLAAVALNPFVVGTGLDEDTAVFIGPDEVMEVVGTKAVTIVDGSGLELASLGTARPRALVSLIGARVHVLVDGGTFDLRTGRASPGSGTQGGPTHIGRPVAADA